MDPEEFNRILEYLRKYFREWEKYTEKGMKMLTAMLNKEWVQNFEVKWRIKSPYRIYEKLSKNKYLKNIILSIVKGKIVVKGSGKTF